MSRKYKNERGRGNSPASKKKIKKQQIKEYKRSGPLYTRHSNFIQMYVSIVTFEILRVLCTALLETAANTPRLPFLCVWLAQSTAPHPQCKSQGTSPGVDESLFFSFSVIPAAVIFTTTGKWLYFLLFFFFDHLFYSSFQIVLSLEMAIKNESIQEPQSKFILALRGANQNVPTNKLFYIFPTFNKSSLTQNTKDRLMNASIQKGHFHRLGSYPFKYLRVINT